MRDGSSTKKKLERCALTLFVEKGIEATTIKDIAMAAQVAEGTLYRHYVSKDELAEALFINAHEEITSQITSLAAQYQTLKEKIKAMVFFFCEKYDVDNYVFNYLLLARHNQMQIVKHKELSAHAQLLPIFNEAIKKKEIAKRDADFYAAILLGVILQAALSRVYGRIQRTMVEDADDLINAIYGALSLSF